MVKTLIGYRGGATPEAIPRGVPLTMSVDSELVSSCTIGLYRRETLAIRLHQLVHHTAPFKGLYCASLVASIATTVNSTGFEPASPRTTDFEGP